MEKKKEQKEQNIGKQQITVSN
uniref:Uncharacterized protein n=1 Tax=Anguilla anguilla TaxID=7936 RepID=A0A0E9RZK5_ANGAN